MRKIENLNLIFKFEDKIDMDRVNRAYDKIFDLAYQAIMAKRELTLTKQRDDN